MEVRILVVDDDEAARRLLVKHLTLAGYQTKTAADGREALRILHQEGAEIIIADWMMPEMDGIELCRTIRSAESIGFVYLIILTAHTGTSKIVEALEAGADDFISKPLNREELLARLNSGVRIMKLESDLARERRAAHKTNAELAMLNVKLEAMATTDELTQLSNRRDGMRRLTEHWARANRKDEPLAVMMLDIDHFKACNDTHGHDCGDAVLKEVSSTLKKLSRSGEAVCRMGGEEFLVLCPCSTAEMAAQGGERLRKAVEKKVVHYNSLDISVTVSVGVAERDSTTHTMEDLLKLADDALYKSKESGRNRVTLAERSEGIGKTHTSEITEQSTTASTA